MNIESIEVNDSVSNEQNHAYPNAIFHDTIPMWFIRALNNSRDHEAYNIYYRYNQYYSFFFPDRWDGFGWVVSSSIATFLAVALGTDDGNWSILNSVLTAIAALPTLIWFVYGQALSTAAKKHVWLSDPTHLEYTLWRYWITDLSADQRAESKPTLQAIYDLRRDESNILHDRDELYHRSVKAFTSYICQARRNTELHGLAPAHPVVALEQSVLEWSNVNASIALEKGLTDDSR